MTANIDSYDIMPWLTCCLRRFKARLDQKCHVHSTAADRDKYPVPSERLEQTLATKNSRITLVNLIPEAQIHSLKQVRCLCSTRSSGAMWPGRAGSKRPRPESHEAGRVRTVVAIRFVQNSSEMFLQRELMLLNTHS